MTARKVLIGENLFLGVGKSYCINLSRTGIPNFDFTGGSREEPRFPQVDYTLWGISRKLITRMFNGVLESFLEGFFIEHYLEDELIDDYYHSYDSDDDSGFRSMIIRPVTSLRRILDIGYYEKEPHVLSLRSDFPSVCHNIYLHEDRLEIEAEFKSLSVLAGVAT